MLQNLFNIIEQENEDIHQREDTTNKKIKISQWDKQNIS